MPTTAKPLLTRVPLVKQNSEGTIKLNHLRRRLEELEALKSNALLQEEIERKRLRDIVTERYNNLRGLIDENLKDLRAGIAKLSPPPSTPVSPTSNSAAAPSEREETFEPSAGRDAALALSWIDRGCPKGEMESLDEERARNRLEDECAFLERQALAAKVMANVSLQQKKLLNLSYSWLRTFLPHCLAKVNRVSFGLLTEEDCEQVLKDDPLVPRSRLKLAVPFVGKDVPSSSSEFAHPDIILGLTILAYRYSGLRRADFNDVLDSMTAEFSREIGPAKDRPSSRRHELWVLESGGRLRGIKLTAKQIEANNKRKKQLLEDGGDEKENSNNEEDEDSKEVVQLKFLSKSNAEQMEKLFHLWKSEPHCVHYYLSRFVFPAYMRHQRVKISASGQSVGGDMLFGRRVGFSGTPSDLLPRELGKCSYETGDDGMMLSTVCDEDVTTYEHLPANWSVEGLLDTIATSRNPRFHALIDTGALVTGYSNEQVAQELLKRGLSEWCDGVVFLDEDDTKKVLVKDTGRVVPADQCGVPLERRFAFYDQIHTTGMDIQHVVNARACLTLGKDMVFRDFVQGAYRMRGIGIGQTVRVFIIPEVRNLIARELRACGPNPIKLPPGKDPVLTEIVAWLVINSMRSEMTQWSMLCLQNITNVFRKNAFRNVLKLGMENANKTGETSGDVATDNNGTSNNKFLDSLAVFEEPIDFSLDSTVPEPVAFTDKLKEQMEEHADFIETPEQRAEADAVLEEVAKYSVTDGRTMERLDSEQEREQEQEQEKEVRSKREQEIEIEKFVDREYTRSDEAQRSWHVSSLMAPPLPNEDNAHPFFPLREFKLRYSEALQFPGFLAASRNYFNPSWTGLRRVKNVVMALEYSPQGHNLTVRTPENTLLDSILDEQKCVEAFDKAFTLLSMTSECKNVLDSEELKSAIRAATDMVLSDEECNQLLVEFGNGKEVNREGLKNILTSGKMIRVVEDERYFVALSLAEAETLRRVIHMQREGESLLGSSSGSDKAKQSNVQVALRYIPMQTLGTGQPHQPGQHAQHQQHSSGLIFDVSRGWRTPSAEPCTGVSPYQLLAAHSSLRFLDCAQHYSEQALNVLVRCLQRDYCHTRELFFQSTIGARRRMERKWQETPLSKLFTMANEWSLLKLHATSVFIRQALSNKGLFLYEAYTAFDFDDNGVLTPAEFFGAMRFLGLPQVTADDVVDMIEAADRNGDGVIDYREFLDMLKEGGVLQDEELELELNEGENEEDRELETVQEQRQMPSKVEPYGADQLREIIALRRREAAVRQRRDRAKRQAYQQAVDIKVFEAELRASRDRKGGSNPAVYKSAIKTNTVFRFNGNDAPIRMMANGKWKFAALRSFHSAKKVEMTCSEGHELILDARYWDMCVICSRRQTKFRCQECGGHCVCQKCHSRWMEEAKKKAEDISDKLTYAHIYGGCSFSLQVPSASLGLSVLDDEDEVVKAVETSKEVTEPEEREDEDFPLATAAAASESIFEVKSESFSVTMEIRVDRLPPRGHNAALLRFFPSTYGRTRSRHLASVYLTPRGRVVSFNRLGETEDEDTIKDVSLVKANTWHIVTLVAKAHEGTFLAYVDGKLSSSSEHLESEALTMRHQLVVFGGGKQAQARGGHLHRLIIHDRALDEKEVLQVYSDSLSEFNTHVVWLVTPGALPGNAKQEIVTAGFSVNTCFTVSEALAALTPRTKCFVTTLSDTKIVLASSTALNVNVMEETEEGNVSSNRPLVHTPSEVLASFHVVMKMMRSVNPALVVIADSSCMTSKVSFTLGERISARYQQGVHWYSGQVSKVNDDDTYSVSYDDGDAECRVPPECMRATSLSRISPSQLYVREKIKQFDGMSSFNDADLRDCLFACEIEYLKRTKN